MDLIAEEHPFWARPGARRAASGIGAFFAGLAFSLAAAPAQGPGGGEAVAGLEELPHWTSSKMGGTGMAAMPFRVTRVFEGLKFNQPLCMVMVPGSAPGKERFVVVERGGNIWSFRNDPALEEKEFFLQIENPRAEEGSNRQKGVLGLGVVFHREFPEKPFVFVAYNVKEGGGALNRVSRFRVKGPGSDLPEADPGSEAVLLEWSSNGHNGCDLKFGPDGMLYISSGDGASPGDPGNVGQTVDNLLGSILRIDVDAEEDGKGYAVPEDNPFVGKKGVRPEIWSYGLRNPWRMNFRPGTSELWIGDNGDEHWEMVHVTRRGANHGWSAFEGHHPFRLSNKMAGPNLEHTPPVVEHSHSEMRSVIGGLFYGGERLEGLKGYYLYGCYFTQKLWGVPVEGGGPGEPRRLAEVDAQLVSFAQDAAGEPFIVALDGGIYRIEDAGAPPELRPIPGRLSETGIFASTAEHRLAAGFLPYEVNAPAWRDGAAARRYFGFTGEEKGVQIQMKPPGYSKAPAENFRTTAGLDRWKFPSGTAFVQTLSLGGSEEEEGMRLETQVILKDRGEWRFLTYAWNEAGDDAELVPEEGSERTIAIEGREQIWRYMSRVDCAACHTQRAMFILGATMAQLNRECDYSEVGGVRGNQLATYARLGIFSNRFPKDAESWPVFVDPRDESADLDARARTYLHVNCAPCHRETGLGGRADFQLLHWLGLAETKAVGQRPLVGLPGVEDARIIAPGEPDRSEVCRRMATREAGKMPLVGSEVVDEKGLELLRRWIAAMAPPP